MPYRDFGPWRRDMQALAEQYREGAVRILPPGEPYPPDLAAVRILQSSLSGPSARYDAEAVLVLLGWPDLAIRLAKREAIGPADGREGPVVSRAARQ